MPIEIGAKIGEEPDFTDGSDSRNRIEEMLKLSNSILGNTSEEIAVKAATKAILGRCHSDTTNDFALLGVDSTYNVQT